MSDGITLFTVRGLPARLLKLLVGTPLVLVGAALVAVGLGSAVTVEGVVPLLIGGVIGCIGLYYYFSAIRSDEFAVRFSSGSGRQDGHE